MKKCELLIRECRSIRCAPLSPAPLPKHNTPYHRTTTKEKNRKCIPQLALQYIGYHKLAEACTSLWYIQLGLAAATSLKDSRNCAYFTLLITGVYNFLCIFWGKVGVFHLENLNLCPKVHSLLENLTLRKKQKDAYLSSHLHVVAVSRYAFTVVCTLNLAL